MIERHIHSVQIDDADSEEPAATRERLKAAFPRGAMRRMTQLGLLVGHVLDPIKTGAFDTLVYASAYGESRALEEYLASFPAASPTLFQTSIHPSAVQQALILRQQPVREFFPLTGRLQLVAHAVRTAFLAPNPRVILCGGEERGTWLTDFGMASNRSFAFAVTFSSEPAEALGKISLSENEEPEGELALPEFFSALRDRRPLRKSAAPGLTLDLSWK